MDAADRERVDSITTNVVEMIKETIGQVRSKIASQLTEQEARFINDMIATGLVAVGTSIFRERGTPREDVTKMVNDIFDQEQN